MPLSANHTDGVSIITAASVDQYHDLLTGVMTDQAVTFAGPSPIFLQGATFPSSGGVVAMGTGDDVAYYVNGVAWEMTSQQGTTGSPINTGSGPNVKVSRTESIPASTMPNNIGSNNQGNAGIWVSALGDAANQAQVSGILATAITNSTVTRNSPAGANPDSCAVNAQGGVRGSGIGTATGVYGEGRRDTDTGRGIAAELRAANYTATDSTFVTNGPGSMMSLWMTAGGNSPSAGAAIIGLFSGGMTYHVGFGAIAGSVTDQTFRDETSSTTSLLINGIHTTAIQVSAGAGPVMIGEAALLNASSFLEVNGGAAVKDPLVTFATTGANSFSFKLQNGSGSSKWCMVGGAGNFMTGSAAGDTLYVVSTGSYHLGSSTVKALSISNAAALTAYQGTATPAGGSATAHLDFGSTPALGIYFGSGAPTASAPKGSLYLRTDGTTTNDRAYINTNASTTWTALTTAA